MILELISGVGLSLMATRSSLLSGPREWISGKSDFAAEMLDCGLCTGFWVGVGLSAGGFFGLWDVGSWLLFPFACAGVSYCVDQEIEYRSQCES